MPRSIDFRRYYELLKYLAENANMAFDFPMYRQKRRYYLKRLEEWGFIRKIRAYPAIYELTELGKEAVNRGLEFFIHNVKKINGLSVREAGNIAINVHAVKIRVPVKMPGRMPPNWELEEKGGLKGSRTYYSTNRFMAWVKKYYPDAPPFTVQITESGGNYSIMIHLGERNYRVKTPDEVNSRILSDALRATIATEAFFRRYGWKIETKGIEVLDQHIAIKLPKKIGKHIPRGTVSTGEPVQTPTGTRPREAKIWTDGTPFPHTLEMDSTLSLEDFLLMGKRIREIREMMIPTMADVSRSIEQLSLTVAGISEAMQSLRHVINAPKTPN